MSLIYHLSPDISAPASLLRSCFGLFCTAEIVLFDGHVVVYKYLGDLMFYVTGSQDENELVLTTVLTAFYEAVSILLR